MKIQNIGVLGGTGFLGKHLVTHLANSGRRIRVLTRHRERHRELIVMPNVELVEADIRAQQVLEEQFSGQDAVINLVGMLNGSEQEFRAVHAELPRRVVDACQQAGVHRLLHMSALNADAVNGPEHLPAQQGRGGTGRLAGKRAGHRRHLFSPLHYLRS